MRGTVIGLLLAAATALAQTPSEGPLSPEEIESIEQLVVQLGADSALDRLDAQRQLVRIGRRVVPLLRAIDPDEPEARMRKSAVLGWFETVILSAELGGSHLAAGQPVALTMKLTNYTRETYVLPISVDGQTPFTIGIGTKMRRLKRSELIFFPDIGSRQHATLPPGQSLKVRVAIGPKDLPRSEETSFTLIAHYVTRNSLLLRSGSSEEGGAAETSKVVGDPGPLSLSSGTVTVHVRTHSARELEAALADPALRNSALLEIRFRTDKTLLPLLRRHQRDEDLRLHAIKRLGQAGDLQDLGLMRAATRDPEKAARVAATLGLANFEHRKARQRLSLLARTDTELRGYAIRALASHRSARSIDTFIMVLKHKYRDGPWVATIQKALKEWTGLTVASTPREVAAFERWWTANRERWMKEEATSASSRPPK